MNSFSVRICHTTGEFSHPESQQRIDIQIFFRGRWSRVWFAFSMNVFSVQFRCFNRIVFVKYTYPVKYSVYICLLPFLSYEIIFLQEIYLMLGRCMQCF